MNLRERTWRDQMARRVARLDEVIEGDQDDALRLQIIVLRDRIAGTLGADGGFSTTAELRERARRDYEAASAIVGESDALDLPEGSAPRGVTVRQMAGFRPARPRHGDRA